MSIQRYVGIEVHEAADGDMIAYEDHLAVYNKAAMNAYMYLATKGQPKLAEEVAQIILEACR